MLFRSILVADEAELDEAKWYEEGTGYEPIHGDPARLDLQLLTEDQTLLALPLVPAHESEDCGGAVAAGDAGSTAKAADDTRQRPFENLRDMLRKP